VQTNESKLKDTPNQLDLAQKYLVSYKNRIPLMEPFRKKEGKISVKMYKKSFANIMGGFSA
jgi:hypothetical protein